MLRNGIFLLPFFKNKKTDKNKTSPLSLEYLEYLKWREKWRILIWFLCVCVFFNLFPKRKQKYLEMSYIILPVALTRPYPWRLPWPTLFRQHSQAGYIKYKWNSHYYSDNNNNDILMSVISAYCMIKSSVMWTLMS